MMIAGIFNQHWPWWITGPLIGLTVPALLIMGNKTFGVSSSLKHICAACFPAKISFFKYDWKQEAWTLFFVAGIVIGGYIAWHWLTGYQLDYHPKLLSELAGYGIVNHQENLPVDIVNWHTLFTIKGIFMVIIGGFLIGFGTRYANGCTSGHTIMGLSNLQWPSLVATICFFAAGVLIANYILPLILKL